MAHIIIRHYGPGPHKSGTPQSVHGRGGAFGRLIAWHIANSAGDLSKKEATGKAADSLLEGFRDVQDVFDHLHVAPLGEQRYGSVIGIIGTGKDLVTAVGIKFGAEAQGKLEQALKSKSKDFADGAAYRITQPKAASKRRK